MTRLLALALLAALPCVGCRSSGDFFEPRTESELRSVAQLEAELAQAEREVESGDYAGALRRLEDVRDSNRATPSIRRREKALTERAAIARLDELVRTGASEDEFEELYEDDVPKRVRVSAAIGAARERESRQEWIEAYEWVRRLDEEFTTHHERAAAGDLLARVGFALAESDDTYLFFFDLSSRAPEVLEYLVLNYPSNRAGERAYLVLAGIYEDEDELETALERYEDLLLYYSDSPFAPYAEARIPALRLNLVGGPEYDRDAVTRAERELEGWLARRSGHELEPVVLETLGRARRLRIDSDLNIGAFYRRVDQDFGARLHADRAYQLAVRIGDDERARRALEIRGDAIEDDAADEEDDS